MRKIALSVLCVSLILGVVAPAALADIKPTDIPHMVMPGEEGFTAAFGAAAAFTDLWEELEGIGAELPQTGHMPVCSLGDPGPGYVPEFDDFVRGPIPIGFTFGYMNGPVEPAPGWPPADWREWWKGDIAPPLPEGWPAVLTDQGYDKVYVSTNGFIVFADHSVPSASVVFDTTVALTDAAPQQPGLGSWNWWPHQLPIVEPPNNFVAPYWTDLAIGDNSYHKVTEVCKECVLWVPTDSDPMCYQWEYLPCEWEKVERPRGRLLYATLGEAPNRKFVVEWLNARNHWTGFLATFQLQLFEGSNAILFLYKDFQTKDPGQAYFDVPSVLIGMEDWYGTTGVGQTFMLDDAIHNWLVFNNSFRGAVLDWYGKLTWEQLLAGLPPYVPSWGTGTRLPAPMANGDMMGFVY